MTTPIQSTNAYVGPRTFRQEDGGKFYGRQYEASELLARVISQRLTLFYAPSGAGKSSIINARLVPQIQEQGFAMLPVGRVSGELPQGITDVENIFLFNLMLSLDADGERNAQNLAHLTLTDFLERLVSHDGIHFSYDPDVSIESTPDSVEDSVIKEHDGSLYSAPFENPSLLSPIKAGENSGFQSDRSIEADELIATLYQEDESELAPYVLIIDQFEEIVTTHLDRWEERNEFFRQLNQAMRADPNFWVVLTLREDYVAKLDPYAPLLDGKLRDRFYMERMGIEGALQAVAKPAAAAGRPFATGVANELVDQLRLVRVHGRSEPQPGQYVEPVQLQVVCYQLWETVKEKSGNTINSADLPVGYIEQALRLYYQDVLQKTLNQQEGTTERALRDWFTHELITEASTRSTVYRDENTGKTAGLPNQLVDLIAKQFLLRTELRAGGAWIELVHDRFIEPILQDNIAWFANYDNPLLRPTQAWLESGRLADKLLTNSLLNQAQSYAAFNENELSGIEREFLAESTQAQQQRERDEFLRVRRQRLLLTIAGVLIILFAGLSFWGVSNMVLAESRQAAAEEAQAIAETETQHALRAEAAAQNQARAIHAGALAVQAQTLTHQKPQLSLLLALEAFNIHHRRGDAPLPVVTESLRNVLAETGGVGMSGHQGAVNSATFSPDGRWLASASSDGKVGLWDTNEPAVPALFLNGHEETITMVDFSPDGRWLASASNDGKVGLWDMNEPAAPARFLGEDEEAVTMVAFSPGNRWLASATWGEEPVLRLWALAALDSEPIVRTGYGGFVGFSPDARWLVSIAQGHTLALWPIEEPTASFDGEPTLLVGHTSAISSVAISSNSRWLATGDESGRTLLWDLNDLAANPYELDGHFEVVSTASFSHDGEWLATASWDNTVNIWPIAAFSGATVNAPDTPDRATETINAIEPIKLKGHIDVVDVAFHPGDDQLAAAHSDGTTTLWDIASQNLGRATVEPIMLYGHESRVSTVQFHPDGQRVMTGSWDTTLRLWTLNNLWVEPQVQRQNSGKVFKLAFSPDGRWIANSSDKMVGLWNVADIDGDVIHLPGHQHSILDVVFSPDSRILASSAADGIRLWQVDNPTDEPEWLTGHEGTIHSLAFSPDGDLLASGSADQTVGVWTTSDPSIPPSLLNDHTDSVNKVTFSPDGHWLASGGDDGQVILREVADPNGEPRILDEHTGAVWLLAFSPDGRWLASGGLDPYILLWDMNEQNTEAILLEGYSDSSISALDFSPDSRWLVAGSVDSSVAIWDMQKPDHVPRSFVGHSDHITSLAFDASGQWLATASTDTSIRLWDLNQEEALPYTLNVHQAPVWAISFSPDGRRLASGSGDATVRLWTVSIEEVVAKGCRIAGRNMRDDEWNRYFSGTDFHKTCIEYD
ncbi:MAG: hypothetical protein AAF702_39935 [Chloroflexota bacterium]